MDYYETIVMTVLGEGSFLVMIVPVKFAPLVFFEKFNGINWDRLDRLVRLVRLDRFER